MENYVLPQRMPQLRQDNLGRLRPTRRHCDAQHTRTPTLPLPRQPQQHHQRHQRKTRPLQLAQTHLTPTTTATLPCHQHTSNPRIARSWAVRSSTPPCTTKQPGQAATPFVATRPLCEAVPAARLRPQWPPMVPANRSCRFALSAFSPRIVTVRPRFSYLVRIASNAATVDASQICDSDKSMITFSGSPW